MEPSAKSPAGYQIRERELVVLKDLESVIVQHM